MIVCLVTAALLLHGVPAAAQFAAPEGSVCYRLSYARAEPDRADTLFPDYVALEPEPDRLLSSGSDGAPSPFWTMFLVGGRWSRSGDTLSLHFTNGFTGVEVELRPARGKTLRGTLNVYYDVVGESPPPLKVTASAIPCPDARLQTPPALNKAELEARRAERRRARFWKRELESLRRSESPLAGTYRVTLQVGDHEPLVLYMRTERYARAPLWGLDGGDIFSAPVDSAEAPATAYQLGAFVSRTPADLPREIRDDGLHDRKGAAMTYFMVGARPLRASPDRFVWAGRTDVLFGAARLIDDAPIHSILEAASATLSDIWSLKQGPGRVTGRFILLRNGEASLWMSVEQKGRRILTVRGTRISDATLAVHTP